MEFTEARLLDWFVLVIPPALL